MTTHIFFILSLSCATALINLPRDGNLTNCLLSVIKEWELNTYNRSYIEFTIVNNNNEFKLTAFKELKNVQYISLANSSHVQNVNSGVYVIVSKDFMELARIIAMLSTDLYWKPSGKFIIVVQHDWQSDLSHIDDLLHDYNIYHVILLLHANEDYALYTYTFEANYCVSYEFLQKFSWCSNGETQNFKQLMARKEKLRIRDCYFKFISENEGYDPHAINLFEMYSGVKINLESLSNQDFTGENITDQAKVILQQVEKNRFEGAICGCSGFRARFHNLSYSYPLFIDNFVYIFPRANLLTPWQTVLKKRITINYMVMGGFVLFCVVSIVFSIFPSGDKSISRYLVLVLGIILNTISLKQMPHQLPHRFILTSLLFFSFILPYILQTHLFIVTTTPEHDFEPKEVSEIGGYNLILLNKFLSKEEEQFNSCRTKLACLEAVMDDQEKSLYTILSRRFFEVFSNKLLDSGCTNTLYTLKDPYGLLLPTVYFRRGSVLLESYERFIFRIAQSGILKKNLISSVFRDRLKCHPANTNNFVSVSLHHLYGSFILLIAGYTLSLMVFMCEFVVFKLTKKL